MQSQRYTKPGPQSMNEAFQHWLSLFGLPPTAATAEDRRALYRAVFFMGAMAFSDLLDGASSNEEAAKVIDELDEFRDEMLVIAAASPKRPPNE